MLPQLKDASADSVFSVLKEISVGAVLRGQEVGTLDSGVWDVTRGELHLTYKRDFDHPRIFKLSEELAKGEHSVDLQTLSPIPSRLRLHGAMKTGLSSEKPRRDAFGLGLFYPPLQTA